MPQLPNSKRKRGFVLLTMAIAAVALFGSAGLAVDLGRMFIAKNETQVFCDAAALMAALRLDGTSAGITAAQAAVTNANNAWNIDSAQITTRQVDFATAAAGPWSTNPSPAAGYTYARVRASVPVQLYFLPLVASLYSQDVGSLAVGAQIAQTSFTRGLGPYTAVSTTPAAPDFGLVVGNQYDIQWPQYNGSRGGCSPSTPDKCFNSPPCSGDPMASKAAITQYWGASVNGYWGSNANSIIEQEVLDVIQLQPVAIGDQITLTSGNKNAQAKALDDRVNEDGDPTDDVLSTYLSNSYHNGRRLMALPVVDPTAAATTVIGYASFFLLSNGSPSDFYAKGTGNDPFCAVYAGPYVLGSESPGGAGQTGAYKVVLVQ